MEQKKESQEKSQQVPAEPNPPADEKARIENAMQQESPRKCRICGGPNHHGCGCEAKAALSTVTRHSSQLETDTVDLPAETDKAKTSAILEAIKVDEKLKSLAVDFASAKVAAEIIRSGAEQITSLLSDILETLKRIHEDIVKQSKEPSNVN